MGLHVEQPIKLYFVSLGGSTDRTKYTEHEIKITKSRVRHIDKDKTNKLQNMYNNNVLYSWYCWAIISIYYYNNIIIIFYHY